LKVSIKREETPGKDRTARKAPGKKGLEIHEDLSCPHFDEEIQEGKGRGKILVLAEKNRKGRLSDKLRRAVPRGGGGHRPSLGHLKKNREKKRGKKSRRGTRRGGNSLKCQHKKPSREIRAAHKGKT